MAAIASVGTPTLRFGAVRSATKATVARALSVRASLLGRFDPSAGRADSLA